MCAHTHTPVTSALRATTLHHHGVRPTQELDVEWHWCCVAPLGCGSELGRSGNHTKTSFTNMLFPLLTTWASGSLLHLQVHCHPSSRHGPSSTKGGVLTGQLWPCPAPCRPWASGLGGTHTQGLSSAAGGGLYPSRGPSLSRPISVTTLLSPPFGQSCPAPGPRLKA